MPGPSPGMTILVASRPAGKHRALRPRRLDAGVAAGDEVGGDAAGAAGERPAEMAVAGIDPQAVEAGAADDRRAGGGDRPQARPDPGFRRVEVALELGEGEAGVVDDRLGAGRGWCRVVAGDLGRAGDAQTVA